MAPTRSKRQTAANTKNKASTSGVVKQIGKSTRQQQQAEAEAADGSSGDDDQPGPSGQQQAANETDAQYALRRQRNNQAVWKSREKKRKQEAEAMQRVAELKAENDELERKVDGLNQELQFLKDMFVQMASGKKRQPNNT